MIGPSNIQRRKMYEVDVLSLMRARAKRKSCVDQSGSVRLSLQDKIMLIRCFDADQEKRPSREKGPAAAGAASDAEQPPREEYVDDSAASTTTSSSTLCSTVTPFETADSQNDAELKHIQGRYDLQRVAGSLSNRGFNTNEKLMLMEKDDFGVLELPIGDLHFGIGAAWPTATQPEGGLGNQHVTTGDLVPTRGVIRRMRG